MPLVEINFKRAGKMHGYKLTIDGLQIKVLIHSNSSGISPHYQVLMDAINLKFHLDSEFLRPVSSSPHIRYRDVD